MADKIKLFPETVLLVEALRQIIQAEDKCLCAFSRTYGDTIEKAGDQTNGERMFDQVGLSSSFDNLIKTVKSAIGDSMEQDIRGLLADEEEEE